MEAWSDVTRYAYVSTTGPAGRIDNNANTGYELLGLIVTENAGGSVRDLPCMLQWPMIGRDF